MLYLSTYIALVFVSTDSTGSNVYSWARLILLSFLFFILPYFILGGSAYNSLNWLMPAFEHAENSVSCGIVSVEHAVHEIVWINTIITLS